MKANILIVEDEFIEANNIGIALKSAGYRVLPIAKSVPEAVRIIEQEKPDIVLLDIFLKGALNGIDLANVLNKSQIPFIFLSGNPEKQIIEMAKHTMPYGFLVKPFRKKDVLAMLEIAQYRHKEKFRIFAKIEKANGVGTFNAVEGEFPGLIGNSASMEKSIEKVKIVGPEDTTVLITGESGTGKELIAKLIHQISPRFNKPFIVVNCAAIPANLIESELFGHERGAFTGAVDKRTGKFELADSGTIFLDEIGEMSPDLQVKFLRVLQEREIEPIAGKPKKVDVRIIAATNKDLLTEIDSGNFRTDLYYRLSVFPITLPPLRMRDNDISLLSDYFIDYYAAKQGKSITGLSPAIRKELQNYRWPGNVRELENIIERAVLFTPSGRITAIDLPVSTPAKSGVYKQFKTISENERDHILKALEHCNWKIYGAGGAAELLDINGSTLKSRMRKLGINKYFGPESYNSLSEI